MPIQKFPHLACPIDAEPLTTESQQLVCKNGHAFDVARQGYINLLPVQHKRSKEPGDSKEMIVARTKFLNSGFYAAVANKLIDIVHAQSGSSMEINVMDAGCGEGYYLDRLADYYEKNEKKCSPSFIGLDISKHAIVAASRRNKQITWVVGTNRQPPICVASVDIILCVFGFHSFEGFNQILKVGGKVILIEPGPEHLKELRDIIYSDVKKINDSTKSMDNISDFTLYHRESLQFKTGKIEQQHIGNLLLMTPHLFRASKEGKEAANQLQQLDLSVDMVFSVFEKNI